MRSLFVLFLLLTAPSFAAQFGPSREYRSINTDLYEVSVQRNGRTDVSLVSRERVFDNAYPMVWLDGEAEPEPLAVDGDLTGRSNVANRLGEGQGMVFEKGPCEWTIDAYPTRPFITAQVVYVNTGKKPVRVKSLIPWAIGAPRKGALSLGPGTASAMLLDNGSSLFENGKMPGCRVVASVEAVGNWNVALWNKVNGRSLIAGCLTAARASTQFRVAAQPDKDTISVFRAECVFDPPVEVPPDGRLESELVYLAVAENDVFGGLERYASTFAVANRLKKSSHERPHGWDSWNTKCKDEITEAGILSALDFMDTNLKRYGWTHLAIDDGWQRLRGDWEPNDRFPHGMKWLADQIRARGMTAGIWVAPFLVSVDAPLAKQHPEWLVEPGPAAKNLVRADERILDVTAPGAYEYVRDLAAKVRAWGYDSLHKADYTYCLLAADHYANRDMTRIEVLNMGLRALREGFGDASITGFLPLPVTACHVDTMRIGDDCAPIWRKAADRWPWGAVEAATNSARRYHFAPHLWRPDPDCAYFGHEATRERWGVGSAPRLTRDQSVAWLTAQVMAGGAVQLGDWLPDLTAQETAILSRLLPTLPRPARPVDLFERDTPAIWSLPLKAQAGQWQIVAVFNWDEAKPAAVPLDLARLGLEPNTAYTVYDFWQDAFYGLAKDSFKVNLAPGSVHLLGLRRYEGVPMFIASDRHFSQGASDHTRLTWDAGTRTLSGVFNGVAQTDYNLRIYVPEGYAQKAVSVSAGEANVRQDDRVLKLGFRCGNEGAVTWSVSF